MQFNQVIGQSDIKKKLIDGIQKGRISHAQLYTGPEGNGKLALALAYAQYINCTGNKDDDSCGQCPSCLKYKKLVHPDLHFVYPVSKVKGLTNPVSTDFIADWRQFIIESPYRRLNQWLLKLGTENLQGSIYTHESNEIIKKLNLKTYEAEYKVMIIWMPEKMHEACSNKLLKMIEEPPPKTIFLLISEKPEDIILTIRSRTQLVKIPKIAHVDLEKHVAETFKVDSEQIKYLVKLSSGNYCVTRELIESDQEKDLFRDLFIEHMRLCYFIYHKRQKFNELNTFIDKVSKLGRERQKQYIRYALKMFRENLMITLSEGNDEIIYLDKSEAGFSARFHEFVHEKNIYKISELLEKAHFHIERNAMDRLVFMDLSLQLMKQLVK